MINLPTYTVDPPGSLSNFVYTLDDVPPPAFGSIVHNPGPQFSCYTTDSSVSGFQWISVLITETNSGLTDYYYVQFMIACVTSVSFTGTPPVVPNYVINKDLYLDVPFPMNGYTLTPASCGASVVLDTDGVTLANGDPLPDSMNANNVAISTLRIETTDCSQKGTYNIKVTVVEVDSQIRNS